VVDRVLSHWVARGHKALLFCQTQQMLDIVEKLADRKVGGPGRVSCVYGFACVRAFAR
jgi:hypothetical protein